MDGRTRVEAKQVALGGAASGQHETGAVQAVARHHHARADVQAPEHPVRFEGHLSDDAKRLAAEPQRIADLHASRSRMSSETATVSRSQRARERRGRRQTDFSVERVELRIHCLDRDQHRRFAVAARGHGQRFGDPGALHSAAGSARPGRRS